MFGGNGPIVLSVGHGSRFPVDQAAAILLNLPFIGAGLGLKSNGREDNAMVHITMEIMAVQRANSR